jgi:hypothetical protein
MASNIAIFIIGNYYLSGKQHWTSAKLESTLPSALCWPEAAKHCQRQLISSHVGGTTHTHTVLSHYASAIIQRHTHTQEKHLHEIERFGQAQWDPPLVPCVLHLQRTPHTSEVQRPLQDHPYLAGQGLRNLEAVPLLHPCSALRWSVKLTHSGRQPPLTHHVFFPVDCAAQHSEIIIRCNERVGGFN